MSDIYLCIRLCARLTARDRFSYCAIRTFRTHREIYVYIHMCEHLHQRESLQDLLLYGYVYVYIYIPVS